MSRFIGTGREAKRCYLLASSFDEASNCVRCTYCDCRLWLNLSLARSAKGRKQQHASLDHVVPGAGHGHDNLVACCIDCNARKGDRTPAEWALGGGPPDALKRALRRLTVVPSWAGLAYTRARYGLSCAGGSESEAEPQGKPRAWTVPGATFPTRGPRRACEKRAA